MALYEIFSYDFSTVENPLSDGGNFTALGTTPLPEVPSPGVCQPTAVGVFQGAQYTGQAIPADQYSEITILHCGAVNALCPIIVRRDNSGDFYYFQLSGNLINTLYAFVGGVQHAIGNVSMPQTTGDVIRLTVTTGLNSNIVSISKNGATFASFTDSTYYLSITSGTPSFGLIAPPSGVAGASISRWATGGPCQLSVAPNTLSFSAVEGGANPASQTVQPSNIGGGGPMPFTFFTNQPWLLPTSGSGTTDFAPITVSVDITGLVPGVYTGVITISTSDCGTQLVHVTLTITGAPPPCVVFDQHGNIISVVISDLTLAISPATALYTQIIPNIYINAYETANEGRDAIVLDFHNGDGLYSRDLGTIFAWDMSARTVLYQWQPSVIDMPEGIYGRATDWDDGGLQGNKFIQGVMVAADSFGNPKTFFLQDSDTKTLHALNECPATFNLNTEQEIAFSCAVPFLAHSARIIATDGVEWRVWSSKLVFQPWPEATINWQTEMTSLGLTGWGHAREMNIPYVSTTPLTLTLTFDAWPTIVLTLPSSQGVQNKTKVTLPANKFKLMGLRITSTETFNLFASDMELKLGEWGRQGAYQVLKPFGGPSRTGALV